MPQRKQHIAVIAAVASNRVIGSDAGTPWHLSEDLRRFRAITTGHSVIMGYRTWELLSAPLPNRQNIVVAQGTPAAAKGVAFATCLDEALELARLPNPVFVIGGASLYILALKIARQLYLTEIHADFRGNVFFPKLEPLRWIEVSRQRNTTADSLVYDFVEYVRRDENRLVHKGERNEVR